MNDVVVDLIERHRPDMKIYVGLCWRGMYVAYDGFSRDKKSTFWVDAPAATVTSALVLGTILRTNICRFLQDFQDLEFTVVSKLE